MKQSLLKELLLYRYRYILGYVLYGMLLIALLTINIGDVPRGLTADEMASATQSATTSISSLLFGSAVNAPYMLLQKISLLFFGLTPVAIKLPSILLALLTGISLALMLSRWFKLNVAVLSGILSATSASFLLMGRTGTATIMTTFWISIILLSATKMLHGKRHVFGWKLLCFVAAALSLYTPLMIYPLLAIGIAGFLHPHVRFMLKRVSIQKFAITLLICGIIVAPLVWSIYQSPSTLYAFLGIPDALPNRSQLLANSLELLRAFYAFSDLEVGTIVVPLFGAASMALIVLGLLKTLADRYSARSYMILLWIVFITPIALLNPKVIMIYFMPAILLLSIGIETLIREWYRLFPLNPYARIVALVPLTILLVSISASNVSRYFYGYLYTPQIGVFQQELVATREALSKAAVKGKATTIVTTQNDVGFYDLLRREYKDISVATELSQRPVAIVLENKYQKLSSKDQQSLKTPYRLVTSGSTNNALLVRVYVSK